MKRVRTMWANTTQQTKRCVKVKKITPTGRVTIYKEFLQKCKANGWALPMHMVDYVNKHNKLVLV